MVEELLVREFHEGLFSSLVSTLKVLGVLVKRLSRFNSLILLSHPDSSTELFQGARLSIVNFRAFSDDFQESYCMGIRSNTE